MCFGNCWFHRFISYQNVWKACRPSVKLAHASVFESCSFEVLTRILAAGPGGNTLTDHLTVNLSDFEFGVILWNSSNVITQMDLLLTAELLANIAAIFGSSLIIKSRSTVILEFLASIWLLTQFLNGSPTREYMRFMIHYLGILRISLISGRKSRTIGWSAHHSRISAVVSPSYYGTARCFASSQGTSYTKNGQISSALTLLLTSCHSF